MRVNVQFNLPGLVLGMVITSILVSVVAISSIVYINLRETIILGFDKKLAAISTATASQIDGREHERILAPRTVHAITAMPSDEELIGVDTSFDQISLVRIDPETGAAQSIATLEHAPRSISRSSRDEIALGLLADDDGASTLVEIDLATGAITEGTALPAHSAALAWDDSTSSLYVGGHGIHKVAPQSGDSSILEGTEDLRVDQIALAPDGALIIYDEKAGRLAKFDLSTNEVVASRALDAQTRPRIHGLAGDGEVIYAASDLLRRIDPNSFEFIETESVPGFRCEQSEPYRRYVEPMRKIKGASDLTFLYTQTLSDSNEVRFEGSNRKRIDNSEANSIIYVLDANTDDEHSPIGYFDEENKADAEVRAVFFEGQPHVTEVMDLPRWGPTKSYYAPIFDDHGDIVGMAGADVNVEKIRERTKIALTKVVVTSLGALALAFFASLLIARKLTEPIDRLREVAQKIAAGEYGERIDPPKLKEPAMLSGTFNELSDTLRDTIDGLQQTNRQWESDRRHFELVNHLTLRNADLSDYGAWVELLTDGSSHHNPSGWTNVDRFVVGWITTEVGEHDENLRFRAGMASLLLQLVKKTQGDWEKIRAGLEKLCGDALAVLFMIDLGHCKGEFVVWGEPVLWSCAPDSGVRAVPLTTGTMALDPETQYVVCRDPGFAESLTAWAEDCDGELTSRFQIELAQTDDSAVEHRAGIAIRLQPSLAPFEI